MPNATYAELFCSAQPQIINHRRSHQRARQTVDTLMKEPRLTKAEGELFDLLTKLIDDDEEIICPTPEVPPANLEASDRRQADNASRTSEPNRRARLTISDVLKGNRLIRVENAYRLAEHFHVDPTLFLARQSTRLAEFVQIAPVSVR